MAGKPKLYYLNGRGRMESIRWLLAAAGVEFVEDFLTTREQYEKLICDGDLLFQQVPMVEIDGMKLVQTRAILNYIAEKYNLHGKTPKEKALIDMYAEGAADLMQLIMMYPFLQPPQQEKQLDLILQRATIRYFPVYEKILKDHGRDFLVGDQLSLADVQLLEAILMVKEKHADSLSNFPFLQDYEVRISNIPTIAKFLQPGSQRKPIPDENYVKIVKRVFQL
uniref:glutathione transferase n=1 Tax=Geotrypetes seraphini TaxID=260995 RepID=A0A6P8R5E2_GEOSA|nr:glutathione S-transferase A4-like [Geotrypetes seraphini]XP_033793846.1 glutathione S-transferase A4-like [Geotrypetes seraphini]XP_033793847.1 glutathione S-transferase A4-like [Geotrypetes seraphini]